MKKVEATIYSMFIIAVLLLGLKVITVAGFIAIIFSFILFYLRDIRNQQITEEKMESLAKRLDMALNIMEEIRKDTRQDG